MIETLEKGDTVLLSSHIYHQTLLHIQTYTRRKKRDREMHEIDLHYQKLLKRLLCYVGGFWIIKPLDNHKDSLLPITVHISPSWLCGMTFDATACSFLKTEIVGFYFFSLYSHWMNLFACLMCLRGSRNLFYEGEMFTL